MNKFFGIAFLGLVAMLSVGCGPRTTTYTETLVNADGSRTVVEQKLESTGGSLFDGVNVRRYSGSNYRGGRYVEWRSKDCGVSYHSVGLKAPHKHVSGNCK